MRWRFFVLGDCSRRSLIRFSAAALVASSSLAGAGLAYASHFRYGHYSWTAAGGNTVEFVIQNAWRRDGYGCRNPAAILIPVPCSGSGGLPGIGDVIIEFVGGTLLDPGDGSAPIGSPAGPLAYIVTSIDPVNNWFFGLALDPASLPAVDTTIAHTYPAAGTYLARTDSCCRISALFGGNFHANNPDGGYRVETLVSVGTGNRPPVSALPPIVSCPLNAVCSFLVPGVDPDGDAMRFRLSSPAEASSFGPFLQPGTLGSGAPNPAGVSAGGLYVWDTTSATTGPPSANTLYSTQVTIEDLDGSGNPKTKAALDFLIQLVPADPNPPVIVPPAGSAPICGTTQVLTVGVQRRFDVFASDPDAGDQVTLNVVGLSVGAAMTPPLPIAGNPISSTFSWTPALSQVGFHVITFTASSTGGGFALCSVTVEVTPTIAVDIDIKPSSYPNSILVNSGSNGKIPVAIVSTATFDAPSRMDLTSLTFGATGDEPSLAFCSGSEDVTGDGRLDVVCHFTTRDTGFTLANTVGTLRGRTVDGIPIEGCDSVRIVGVK